MPRQGSYGAPAQAGYGQPVQGGYGAPVQGGYGAPAQGGYGPPVPQGYSAVPAGDPGAQYGAPQAPKSKTALIIAAVVGDDAALNQLAQSCFDGDMGACDDLFIDSPVAAAYEDYGNTCGGRIDEAEVDARFCVDIF